jgi:hypothetical protein
VVHLFPDEPRFATASESEVWTRLKDSLGPDDLLLANVRLTDDDKDHEADLVVLMPGFGCVVLEVKGGSVWHDDGWWVRRGDRDDRTWPVDQARDAKWALKHYVESEARWGSRGQVAWAHGVVVPHSDFPGDFTVPDLPRHALHARGDLEHMVGRLRRNATAMAHTRAAPTDDDVWAIADILAGRRTTYDVNAEAREGASTAERLTQEQATLLGVTRLLRRVEVRGGAGSGKTVMALQQARDLSRGREGRPAERVALLCYSIGLAEHLKRSVAAWPRRQQPAFVGTFHEFGKQWGAPDGDRMDSDFWETTLPTRMAELASELPDGHRYDSVIVDEAQDFADSWWTPVLGALRDEDEGGLYLYSDERQRVFGRYGEPPVSLVPLVLDHNLRNTRQIYEAFGSLAPTRMKSFGVHGPAVRFVPSTVDDALETADDEVVRLLEESGWDPGGVCLLTTGHRHPVQVERTEHHDQEGYWRTFWEDDDVFYGHVLGCKGLEREAVVLCVNDDGTRDRARERLYVGMSRATHSLVVVGDPDVIRLVGGPEVARRLGL